jgi:hypothetical protein
MEILQELHRVVGRMTQATNRSTNVSQQRAGERRFGKAFGNMRELAELAVKAYRLR